MRINSGKFVLKKKCVKPKKDLALCLIYRLVLCFNWQDQLYIAFCDGD